MIKYFFIAFCFISHVLSSTTVDRQEHCIRRDFPNYFALLSEEEALKLIDQAIASVLHQLKVPHIENGVVVNDGFFEKINRIVHDRSPGAKVYISGGMVRSILGYIYKKFYNEEQRSGPMTRTRVLEVFDRIIMGQKRKDPLPFQPEKELIPLDALGIGSDYDLLIDFNGSTENADVTKKAVVTFINSVETHFGLKNDSSDIKRAVVPVADIKDYHEQITRTTAQGGSSLDWLAYPLDGGSMRMPEKHMNIMHNFYKGTLEYTNADKASDKQTMRGLRALLEIPFLVFDEKSENVIIEEMKKISSLSSELSDDAKKQLQKMTRNARFGSAHNRFETSCMPDDKLIQAIKGMMGDKRLIPGFLDDKRVSQYKHEIDDILMPMNDFIEKYTVNGTLYHGTKDLTNLLYMLRNGFYVSKDGANSQGTAAYGSGVYATKDYDTAKTTYAGPSGIVVPLIVRQDQPLRIVDMSDEHVKQWLNKNNITNKETLAKEYGIDIIVNQHVILQNAKAVKIQKNISQLIQGIQDDMLKKVESGESFDLQSLTTVLSPNGGYTLLAKVMDPSYKGVDRQVFLKFLGDRLTKDEVKNVQAILDNFDYLAPLIDFSVNKDDVEIGVEFCLKNRPGKEFFDMFESYSYSVYFMKAFPDMKASAADGLIQLYKAGVMKEKLWSYDINDLPKKITQNTVDILIQLKKNNILSKVNVKKLKDLPEHVNLNSDAISALIKLYNSSCIYFFESQLKDIPEQLNSDIADAIIKIHQGIMTKSSWDPFSTSDLQVLTSINPNVLNSLTELYKADAIVEKPSVSDLQKLASINPNVLNSLTELYKAGAKVGKLSVSDLQKLASINPNLLDRLTELYKAGFMNENISIFYLKNLSAQLNPEAVEGVIQLYKAGVLEEKLSAISLGNIPAQLNPETVKGVIQLYQAGVMDEKLSPFSLGKIPAQLNPDTVKGVIQLYQAGVMDKKLSIYSLDSLPAQLNSDTVRGVIQLYDANAMYNFLLPSDFKKLSKYIDPNVINQIIELINRNIVDGILRYDLECIPEKLNLNSDVLSQIEKLIESGIMETLRVSDLEFLPQQALTENEIKTIYNFHSNIRKATVENFNMMINRRTKK